MRKLFASTLALVLALSLTACGAGTVNIDAISPGTTEQPGAADTTSVQTPAPSADQPGGLGGGQTKSDDSPGETVPSGQKSPPDCIWTLTGTVTGSIDISAKKGIPGLIQNLTFEFQFDKLSGGYPSGTYDGSIYVGSVVDATEFIKNALKNIPEGMAGLNADVKSYGLRNGVTFNVYNYWNYQQDRNIWPATVDQGGNPVTPGQDEYVAEGTVAINYKGVATAGGWGSTGAASFKIGDYTSTGEGVEDILVRFVIEPNSVWGDSFYTNSVGERKVRIYVSAGGEWFTGEGTLTRQPGGLENQTKFTRDMPQSLGEKHGVDPTS